MNTPAARAETFTSTGGTLNWNIATNWIEGTFPNAIGAVAIFNTPLANQSATLAGTSPGGITIGSITFNSTGTPTMGIPNGAAGGPLIFDEIGTGPATVTTIGGGSGNSTISATLVWNDSVTVFANNTTTTAGVTFSGAITGPGGFTKEGDGIATMSSATKAYTGPTVLNAGRMRISLAGVPLGTSSFTVNAGAQLTLIATDGSYTLGAGVLNLNGTGTLSGPQSVFPGAIRNDTSRNITITNPVTLQSDTLVHVQGSATGLLKFNGIVSGPGKLTLMALDGDANLGTLVLTQANTYMGGTRVNGGILDVNSDAALGAPGAGLELDGNPFNGYLPATLRASGKVSTTLRTLSLGSVLNNVGGTIDTNGNEVTFGIGSTIQGTTLNKIGLGKLTIAGTQTYGTLDAKEGRTDVASRLGTGTSALYARTGTGVTKVNISASQTLETLSIEDGAVVTFGSPLPPAPASAGADDAGDLAGGAQAVPEPGSAALLLGGFGLLLGLRRRR